MNLIEQDFKHLGRSEKVKFISDHIELASAHAVADYVRGYFFDVLLDLDDDNFLIDYITDKGYKVERRQPDERIEHVDHNNNRFLNEMSIMLVKSYAPNNKFKREMIRLLSPLHGMCIETARISELKANIVCLANQLELECPRRTTAARFCVGEKRVDPYGKVCRAVWLEDTKFQPSDDFPFVTIYIYPLKGMLHFVNDRGHKRMHAVPFDEKQKVWGEEYNNRIIKTKGIVTL